MSKRTPHSRDKVKTHRDISPVCLRLVRLFQSVGYGRIENLKVRDGEPVEGPVTIVQSIRTDKGDHSDRKDTEGSTLKKQHVVFFRELARLGTGTVRRIDVQDGLPLRMEVEKKVEL